MAEKNKKVEVEITLNELDYDVLNVAAKMIGISLNEYIVHLMRLGATKEIEELKSNADEEAKK